MTPFEVLSIFISIGALVVSYLAFRKSSSVAYGNLELYINERITNTKDRVGDISITISPLASKIHRTPDENSLLDSYSAILNAAIEGNLNAYEEACAKYLDQKVDKQRFKKSYRTEIRQLVENEMLKDKFDPLRTRYKAILKVYNEWEDLEN